jgi:hypothetical protein
MRCGGRNFWLQSSVSTPRDEGQAHDVGHLRPCNATLLVDPQRGPEAGIKDGLRPVPQSFAEEEHRIRVSAAHWVGRFRPSDPVEGSPWKILLRHVCV